MVAPSPSWWRVALQILRRVALFVLAFALIGALLFVPPATVLSEWADAFPLRARLYGDIAGAISILAATWVMTRFVDRRPFRTIGFSGRNVLRDLATGLAVGIGWLAASIGGLWAAGWASPEAPGANGGRRGRIRVARQP